jgi:hypothetical protein
MQEIQPYKYLIIAGIILILAGLVWWCLGDKQIPFGKLPGDFRWEQGNTKIYFPFTTMIILSLVLNLIVWVVRKLL